MVFESKKYIDNAKNILSNKKVQWGIVLVLFSIILFLSISIRLNNLDVLVDETNGEYIPTALDPYYFLRLTETYIDNDYSLPGSDDFRYSPAGETSWHHETFFKVNVFFWRVLKVFNEDVNLRLVSLIFPVVFFGLFLIGFFLFSYVMTKNKWVGLFSSLLIAFSSSMLYRGMAGFYDHDIPGMFMFILTLGFFMLFIYRLNFEKKDFLMSSFFGVCLGLLSIITYSFWSGVFRFFLIIIPLSFFLLWIFNTKEEKTRKNFSVNGLLFYLSWIFSTFLLGLVFGFPIQLIFGAFTSSNGILAFFVFLICLIDFVLINFNRYFKKFKINEKFSLLYSLGISFILGFFGLYLMGRNPFSLIKSVFYQLLYPFGTSRVGLTVAENAQPFVSDWISNVGGVIFWMFLFGVLFLGFNIIKGIKNNKHKLLFFISYVLMVCGVIFSKYSSSSLLFNGETFLSSAFYFVPLVWFLVYFIWLYFNDEFYISSVNCVLFSIMFFTIVSGRAAVRVFFSINPFMTFFAAYFLYETFIYWRKSKDEVLRVILGICLVFFVVMSLIFVYNSYNSVSLSSNYITPSANSQWQNAMGWVRNNTNEDSIFAHWWDYGYWVQTLGERRTVSDGGHFQSATNGNHNIGRYVLTTPNPDSALSYFKSMNVNYLLIDQTDLGKYTAYSKIGSDEEWDRYSVIPVGVKDETQTQETANEIIEVYAVQGVVDSDIVYNDVFLPSPSYSELGDPTYKAYLIGVVFNRTQVSLNQPYAIFYYNNKQFRLPVRYVYIDGEIYDFKKGIDSVIQIIPSLNSGEMGYSVDPRGALVYLSPKVKDGLFAQLYLLDDAFNNYPGVELAHEEYDEVISSLRVQNVSGVDEFIYYQGFRGPIKIWKVSEASKDAKVVEEFYSKEFVDKYAQLDYLFY